MGRVVRLESSGKILEPYYDGKGDHGREAFWFPCVDER